MIPLFTCTFSQRICSTTQKFPRKQTFPRRQCKYRITTVRLMIMKYHTITFTLLLVFCNVAFASWFSSLFGFNDESKKPSSDISPIPPIFSNSTATMIKRGPVSKATPKRFANSTTIPTKHTFDDYLLRKVKENVERLGSISELVFIGDSFFYKVSKNRTRWTALENKYGAINLGSPGDRSEHLLHRCSNGNILSNITAEGPLVVVMMGISNANLGDSPNAIVDGITATISLVNLHLRNPKFLLMSLIPRLAPPVGPILTAVNAILKEKYGLEKQNGTEYLDITKIFINENATLNYALLNSDKITPNADGQVGIIA